MQKLLYYAQAWSLVFRGKTLFYESIEAWVHGPVIPSVYQRYKHHGYNLIPQENRCSVLTSDEIDVLNTVWVSYGKQSAKFLEELTHFERPWVKARERLQANQLSNKEISIRDMKSYYTHFVESEKPPKISRMALQKRKDVYKRSAVKNFLIGMGSVLNIHPLPTQRSSYIPSDFADSLPDFESMSSDWEKVGGHIQNVFDVVEKKSLTEYE